MAKKAKKVNKTTKSRTGAQFFQSDAEKKARLAAGAEKTDIEKAINAALDKKLYSREFPPEKTGSLRADVFVDSVEDAIKRPPKGLKHGGAVMKGRGGSFKGVN